MAAYVASRLPGARSRPTASAAPRPDGTSHDAHPDAWPLLGRPVQPARRRPEEHQLRRRQHLRQGHRDRPGHRRGRRAALGQGLRRRPRHAHRVRPRRAAPRPDARARRRLPGRRARGRDGRGVRLLPARQGRRRPVDRHRDARPRRRGARRPPAPRLRHRDRDRRRRRGADQGDLRRPGRVGAVAAPRLPARPRHRRDQGGQPAGGRLHPRRPRHHGVGRHVRGVRERTRSGSSTPPRPTSTSTAGPSRSARPWRGTPLSPRPSVAPRPPRSPPPSAGSPPRTGRWSGTSPTPTSSSTSSRSAEHPRLAALGTSCPDHFLRTKVKPLVLDLPADARRSRRSIARLKELHGPYREDYQALLRPQRHRRTRPRSAAPTR